MTAFRTALVLSFLFAGSGHAADSVRQLRDDAGDSIAVGSAPCRIVSLAPGTTAMLFAAGAGHCMVGSRIFAVNERDLVNIPGMTWHQFRASGDAPMGFLCVVNQERDKPQLPTEEDLRVMRADASVAAFIQT